jgi:hypothetical protein
VNRLIGLCGWQDSLSSAISRRPPRPDAQFYQRFYHVALSEAQIDRVLAGRIEAIAGMSHRFAWGLFIAAAVLIAGLLVAFAVDAIHGLGELLDVLWSRAISRRPAPEATENDPAGADRA